MQKENFFTVACASSVSCILFQRFSNQSSPIAFTHSTIITSPVRLSSSSFSICVSFPVSPVAVRLSQLIHSWPRFPSLSHSQAAAQLHRSSTLRVIGGIGVSVSFISLGSDLASLKSSSSISELIFAAFNSFVFPALLSVVFPVIQLGSQTIRSITWRCPLPAVSCNHAIRVGAIVSHVFFYGSDLDPVESLPEAWKGKNHYVCAWNWAYPNASGGIDNPMMNPVGPRAPSLAAGLGYEKILVCVARKDKLKDRGVRYYEGVKKSGWKGILELFKEEEEGHGYHIQKPLSENSQKMIKRLGEFLLG